jgi:cytochrome oxidase Cu insertion factor (SCO1/SenC/PrrC family)
MNRNLWLPFLGITVISVVYFVAAGLSQETRPKAPAPAGSAEKTIPAPELTDVSDWVNSKPFKLADQKGKVVVVHFWTNG